MKRNMIISTAALIAVLGTSMGAVAAGNSHSGHDRGRGNMAQFDLTVVDADGDGNITLEEFEAHKAARFAEIDANGDGGVSQEELTAHHDAQQQERANKKAEADAERAEKRAERMDERATKTFADRDTDGNGLLSAEELSMQPQPKSIFERLDTNEDGVISAEELAAMKDRMGGRGERHGKK